jgi:hypothetical protein
MYKSLEIDQIPTGPTKAGVSTLRSEIHRPINSIRNKEEFQLQWKETIIVPIYKRG